MKLGFLKMNQTTQTMYFYKFLKIYQHLNTPLSIFVELKVFQKRINEYDTLIFQRKHTQLTDNGRDCKKLKIPRARNVETH